MTAYGRAGAGTPGPLAVVAGVPAVNQVSIAPNGKVITAAADAWTDLDVSFIPEKGNVVEFDYVVVPGTGILTLPANITSLGAVTLLSVTATVGTLTGAKAILVPGAAPAAGQARFNTAKTQVLFAVADAVSMAHVKVLVASSPDVYAVLESTSNYI
jgi:hypothetical protein